MSRILIWSPNYAPELIGIPPLVTSASEWLASREHEVHVVTAMPNYPERRIHREFRGRLFRSDIENGVHVHRSWLRVRPRESFLDKTLYEWSFALLSLPRAWRCARAADVVLCVVPSLAAAALAATVVRPARLVFWVQDLVAAAAGSLDRTSPFARGIVQKLEQIAFVRADRMIVCSPGFVDVARRHGVAVPIETIYNWVDTREIVPRDPTSRERTRFLYAGNLGYTQGFETLIEATRLVGGGIEVEIVGGGNAAASVAAAAVTNVVVRPSVARTDYPALLTHADVHLVLQRRVSAGANLPSKIASYLASGRPILASIGSETPAADLLRASGAAVLVEPDDPQALADAMRGLRDDPGLRVELGARGREFALAQLGRESSLEQLEQVLLG